MRPRRSAHRWRAATACLLLMSPVPVLEPAAERAGETSLTLGAGAGTYNHRLRFQAGMSNCGPISREVHFNADFTDFGADLEHRTGEKGRIGIRAGLVRERVELVPNQSVTINVDSLAAGVDPTQNNFYLNPYTAADGTYLGAGAGVIVASEPLRLGRTEDYPPEEGFNVALSGHLRVGKRSRLYASASAGENVPIYSGGGFYNYGFGVDIPVGLDLWAGKTLGPWREDEWLVKAAVHPSPHWSVGASFRLGSEAPHAFPGTDREYGASLRFTRRFE